MRLGIGLFDSPNCGELMLDLAALGSGHSFGTGEHGFDTYTCFVPLSLIDAFRLYDRPGLPWVQVTWQGGVVWEGRVEDVSIVDGGVQLTAFGAWAALYDVPYTALWSSTRVDAWRPLTEDDIAFRNAEKYQFDFQNRIYVTLPKGEAYLTSDEMAAVATFVPDDSDTIFEYITVDYAYNLPANWRVRLVVYNSSMAAIASQNITTTGGAATGTSTWTIATAGAVCAGIEIMNLSGATTTVAVETGVYYAKFTNVRVTANGPAVGANEIAGPLVVYVNALNPTQLSSSTALIDAPGVDLTDEVYEDQYPADILDHLAALGDNASPAQLWEVGVWEGRMVTFRQRLAAVQGGAVRQWYVDASSLELDRTLDTLRNSVYATYQDASGRTLRTDIQADAASVARLGLTRREAARANTTTLNFADQIAGTTMRDKRNPKPAAALMFRELYDAAGVRWPLFMARAWDRCTVRNLPPTLSVEIDRIRTFRILETRYDADNDLLEVVPESHPPRVEMLLARLGAGLPGLRRQ